VYLLLLSVCFFRTTLVNGDGNQKDCDSELLYIVEWWRPSKRIPVMWVYVVMNLRKLSIDAQQFFCNKSQYKNNGQNTEIKQKIMQMFDCLDITELML